METVSYKLGRAWGSMGLLGKSATVLVVVLAVGALAGRNSDDVTVSPASAPKAAEDWQAKRKAALQHRCVDEVATAVAAAASSLKAGATTDAVNLLAECDGTMVDQKAIALLETARKQQAAQIEKDRKVQAAAEKARKRREGVVIGMSAQDVLDSSWGRPESVNRTTTTRGTREQWVYGGRNYLYFENGVLTTIQN